MNVTIVGGGNVGTQIAVHAAETGNKVTVYTTRKAEFSKFLRIVDQNGELLHGGEIVCATDDPEIAFAAADIVFVTTPSFLMKTTAEKIYPHVKAGAKIGLVPGGGGGECAFKPHVEKGCTLFGLQRVPSVARLIKYGDTVRAVGYRKALSVAAIPSKETQACAELVRGIFQMDCIALPNYLNVALTPSNPILHTTRLRVLFSDYAKGKPYPSIPLFYEDWNDESSELLLLCDAEVQKICRALAPLDTSQVKSLKEHYESPTAEKLTAKIRSIEGFKGIKTPMVEADGGYYPDWDSRYFTADFSYGLKMLLGVAELFGVDTPYMRATQAWYEETTGNRGGFSFADYGVTSKQDFYEFYGL